MGRTQVIVLAALLGLAAGVSALACGAAALGCGNPFAQAGAPVPHEAGGSARTEAGYGGAMVDAQEKARRLKCQNNLRQIGLALFMYRETFGGKWPNDLETLVDKKYLTTTKVLQCPSANSPPGSVDYALVRTEGREFNPTDIIVYDRKTNHKDGRNVLLFSQQVLWLSEEEFKKRMGNEPAD